MLNKRSLIICLIVLLFITVCAAYSKSGHRLEQSDRLDLKQIYGYGLKGEIDKALQKLETSTPNNEEDIEFKEKFFKRFKYREDKTDYIASRDKSVKELLTIYRDYWRKGLLNKDDNFDEEFKGNLLSLFIESNKKHRFTDVAINNETLPIVFEDYIDSKKMYTVGFDKTGKFYDLLVWKTNEVKQYEVELMGELVRVDVYWMDNFVSLGWTSYARLEQRYPGGWATKEALYAVSKGYDRRSESFKVNYLKHEAQHFQDYQQFPSLKSYDLEYRGKLVELYYGDKELYERLYYFIDNAKYDKSNSHPFANYCVISDMSQKIFGQEMVVDKSHWGSLDKLEIQQAAKDIYQLNTLKLSQKSGSEHFIGEAAKCGGYR